MSEAIETERLFLKTFATTLDTLKENYLICLDFIQSKKLEKEFVAYHEGVIQRLNSLHSKEKGEK